MPLTDDAKREIAEAIRIVREDKFEQYARTALARHAPVTEKETEKKTTEIETEEKVTPPPTKEDEKKVGSDVTKRVDGWWGEIESD